MYCRSQTQTQREHKSRQRAAQLEHPLPVSPGRPTRSRTETQPPHPTSPSTPGRPLRADTQGPPGKRVPMADASPLLPPAPGKSSATAARFARSASSANDELRSFRACLAWLCVDHSSCPRVAAVGSWAVFLLLAIAAPAAVRLLPHHRPPAMALRWVGPSLFDPSGVPRLCLPPRTAPRVGGLRRLLYLDNLHRDSEDMQVGRWG